MEIVRFYEATIQDQEHGLAASITVLPSGFLEDEYDPANPRDLLGSMGIEVTDQIRAGRLIPALAYVLSPEAQSSQAEQGIRSYWTYEPSREILAFAEYLAFAEHVPFENSPLSGESIGSLIAQATGAGLGAFVGFVLAAGTPFVLIAVPGGMILLGAAAGVARGLDEGLHDAVRLRVRNALKARNKKSRMK